MANLHPHPEVYKHPEVGLHSYTNGQSVTYLDGMVMHFPGIIQGSRVMCAQSELAKLTLFVDSCPMMWVLGLQLYIHSFTAHWANPAVRGCNSHLIYRCHLGLLNISKYG